MVSRIFVWLLLPLVIVLNACQAKVNEASQDTQTLIRLADSEIRGLDPQKYSDLASMRVAMDQFEGLTRFDGHGEAVPGLAESWRTSQDGRTWTFALRPGLHFSDSAPISAQVFPAIWARMHDAATASPHIALFDVIADVTAPDDGTVMVQLSRPMPQLPALLAHPAMSALPLHAIAAKGEAWTADRPLVTSGPYRLTDWRLNDALRLAANPAWHDAPAKIPAVTWKPVEDSLTAMRLFMSRGADIVSDFPESRYDWLQARLGKSVHTGPYLGSYYFTLNTRKPPFDDRRVRQALSMAVDRQWLSDKLSLLHEPPAWGVVPPSLYEGTAIKPAWAKWPLEKRRTAARDLLAQAGYGPENPFVFDIRINSSTEHRRMAVALAAMWRELGVEAHILNSEAGLHFATMRRGDFAMARSGWIGDIPAAENFLAVHLSDAGPGNYSGYDSPRFDAALRAAMTDPDPKRRSAAMQRAETILVADAPVIPLYYYVTRSLVSERTGGWHDNAANMHPSATLSLAAPKGAGR